MLGSPRGAVYSRRTVLGSVLGDMMWVRKVPSIAGACAIGAGFIIGGTVITPPSLMRVALADDAENPVAAPAGGSHSPSVHMDTATDGATPVPSVPAPADVAAAALLPGMDPGSLTENPDGSLVYHGTTPAGVETPGWSAVASSNGLIEMVRGPVAPAPAPAAAAAGPLQPPTSEPYQAEGTVPLPEGTVSGPGMRVSGPEGTVWLPEGTVWPPEGPGPTVPQP